MPAPTAINQLTSLFSQQPLTWDQMSPMNKLAATFGTTVPEPPAPDRQTDLPFDVAYQQAASRAFTPPTQPTPWRDVIAALGNVAQMGIMGRGGFGGPPLSRVTIGNSPDFGPPGSEAAQLMRQVAGIKERRAAGVPSYQATTDIEKEFAKLGQPRRVYHGTPVAYQEMDPKMAGKGAGGDLYGPSPGGYWTESADVAAGYASSRAKIKPFAYEDLRGANEYAHSVGGTVELRGATGRAGADKWWEVIEPAGTPNIRVAYLDITKPFDVQSPDAKTVAEKILRSAGKWREAKSSIRNSTLNFPSAYDYLEYGIGDKVKILDLLKAEGYDGITHIGQSGARQWIPFRLDQIHEGFVPPMAP